MMETFELNKAIAELVYPDVDNPLFVYGFDYTNWNDLIPLMIEHDVYYQIDKHTKQNVMAATLLEALEVKK